MTMRLGFVVQRYGLEIAGGAEYHCRLVAERLARHARVEVLTTCARDYITWAEPLPGGRGDLNGVRVRRFRVERPRDAERYRARHRARASGRVACIEPGRVDAARAEPRHRGRGVALARRAGALLAASRAPPRGERATSLRRLRLLLLPLLPTCRGLHWRPRQALLVPTAEDDGAYRLPLFPPLFQKAPRARVQQRRGAGPC